MKKEHKIIAGIILSVALFNVFMQYRSSKKMEELKQLLIKNQ
jgi:type II secretory pathway pseudopilin PulG